MHYTLCIYYIAYTSILYTLHTTLYNYILLHYTLRYFYKIIYKEFKSQAIFKI